MSADLEIFLKIAAPLLAALSGWVINRYFAEKPKLYTHILHADAIVLPGEPTVQVNVHVVVVRNAGKKAAQNVRVGHHELPRGFKLQPPLAFEIIRPPVGTSAEILIPSLAPGEQVSITYLYFPPMTWQNVSSYAKSDDGLAKHVAMISNPKPGKAVLFIVFALMFLGASTAIYWLFTLAVFVLSRTTVV